MHYIILGTQRSFIFYIIIPFNHINKTQFIYFLIITLRYYTFQSARHATFIYFLIPTLHYFKSRCLIRIFCEMNSVFPRLQISHQTFIYLFYPFIKLFIFLSLHYIIYFPITAKSRCSILIFC